MTDLIPAPPTEELSPAEIARRAQVTQVLQLMIDEGITQAEACIRSNIEPRTFQRHVAKMRDQLDMIRRETEGALVSGAVMAMKGYLDGISRLIRIANGPSEDPDAIRAIKELRSIVKDFAGLIPAGASGQAGADADDEKAARVKAADMTFNGPVTFQIAQRDGIPITTTVIEGEVRELPNT